MFDPIDISKIVSSDAPKEVVEVYKYLKRYRENTDREWWLENCYKKPWEAAYENKLWDEKDVEAMEKKGMLPLVINDMAKGIQGSAAVVTASKPGIIINPIGMNDLYVAELMQRGITNVWDQTKSQRKLFKLVAHCKTGTIGCLDIKYDKSKGLFGRVLAKNFKATQLFWDKDAEEDDLSDSPLIKARLITRTYAKDNYEGIKDEDLEFTLVKKEDEPSKSSGVEGADNYAEPYSKSEGTDKEDEDKKDVWEIEAWLIKKVRKYCVTTVSMERPDDIQKKFFDTEEEAATIAEMLKQNPTVMVGVTPEKVEVRIHRIIVGKKLIEEEENPYGVDSNHEPVVPTIALMHDETLRGYPTGPSFRALELSRERNKRRAQSIYTVTKNLEAMIVTGEGFKIQKDAVHGDMMVVSKDMAFQPNRLLPGTTPQEAMALEKAVLEDIKNEYDTQDVMVGKMPTSQLSGRAVMALQDMGSMMSKPFIEKVEDCAVRMAKVYLAIITKYWPRNMWMRLIEPDELQSWQPDKEKQFDDKGQEQPPNPQEVQSKWMQAIDLIMKQKVSLINVDVKVSAGSTLPTNRMAKREDAIEMVKAGIYDPEAALDYVDDPYKDQVKDRIKQKAQNTGAPEKINYSVSIKVETLPAEVQAQILGNMGVQMNPQQAITPDMTQPV